MLGDWVQKAVYLGVGLASYAGEKASEALNELPTKANEALSDLPTKLQELTDELVARGEMTTEEARRYVDGVLGSATGGTPNPAPPPASTGPRSIEILEAEVEDTP